MMPQMDGIETTKKLRENGYTGFIIALTANAIVGNEEMFKQNGFDGFVSKPIDIRHLNNALNKFVRDRHTAEEWEAAKTQGVGDGLLENGDTELLAIFNRDAGKTIPVIEDISKRMDTASDEDRRMYVVHVHAMKSALANIGEKKASMTADMLERAGKEGNVSVIKTETPAFLEKLRDITQRSAAFIPETEAGEDSDPAYLREQLTLIAAACDDYDNNAAEDLLGALQKKPWSKETTALLDEIAEQILHSEFENAAEIALGYVKG
jgi:FixJ family two-component response regulator